MSAPTPPLLNVSARGIEIARLVAWVEQQPWIRFEAGHEIVAARTLIALAPTDLGREVAVEFIGGDIRQPLILGLLHGGAPSEDATSVALEVDGKHVAVRASEQLTLRCGKASITLDADGRIVIKGAQILTQATGSQRIRGATIQLN